MYQKVFAKWFPIELYTACATSRKRVEAFLRGVEKDSGHRNNLLFYVLFAAGRLATKSENPTAKTLAKKLTTAIDDPLLSKALNMVRPLYETLGGDDKAAKGTDLVKQVRAALVAALSPEGKK